MVAGVVVDDAVEFIRDFVFIDARTDFCHGAGDTDFGRFNRGAELVDFVLAFDHAKLADERIGIDDVKV